MTAVEGVSEGVGYLDPASLRSIGLETPPGGGWCRLRWNGGPWGTRALGDLSYGPGVRCGKHWGRRDDKSGDWVSFGAGPSRPIRLEGYIPCAALGLSTKNDQHLSQLK